MLEAPSHLTVGHEHQCYGSPRIGCRDVAPGLHFDSDARPTGCHDGATCVLVGPTRDLTVAVVLRPLENFDRPGLIT